MVKHGVLTGCNEKQEWLLKPWWNHYSAHNSYPVTFVDFGMSTSARKWCEKRGTILPISPIKIVSKDDIDPKKIESWNRLFPESWESRPLFFTKPQAFLQSPYEKTAWIDLDAFTVQPLTSFFEYLDEETIAAAAEQKDTEKAMRLEGYHNGNIPHYCMGVVGFTRNHPILKKWANLCLTQTDQYFGDQDLFCHLIVEENLTITELPTIYNWRPLSTKLPENVTIIHYSGSGKLALYARLQNFEMLI